MAVYIDPQMSCLISVNWRWPHSCHMFADTLKELNHMALLIGMNTAWFQNKRVPHYDLNENKRKLAVKNGVIELTREETVKFWREKGWLCTRS